jgi:hypothetical protein
MIGRSLAQSRRHCIRWLGVPALTISLFGMLGCGMRCRWVKYSQLHGEMLGISRFWTFRLQEYE